MAAREPVLTNKYLLTPPVYQRRTPNTRPDPSSKVPSSKVDPSSKVFKAIVRDPCANRATPRIARFLLRMEG